MRRVFAVSIVGTFLFSLLAGCGGGGGGSTKTTGGSTGVLTVFADFTPGTAGGPVGTSEIFKVTTLNGTVLQTSTTTSTGINQTPKQVAFSNLPNANLILIATLYSGTNGTGTATGFIQYAFSGATSTSVVTGMGMSAAQLVVGPTPVAITQGSTQQLAATVTAANGDIVFQASNPTWSIASGSQTLGSINAQGAFTGSGIGLATVNAAAGSLTASSQVSVTGVSTGSWTIMLFLNSANDLDAESLVNIKQIEEIAQNATSPTKFVIQWKLTPNAGIDVPDHPFWGTRRYLAASNNLEFLQDLGTGIDMGSQATLKDFVNWTVQNYPAQHYMLIMWDHGNGWFFRNAVPTSPRWRGISYDFETGNHIDVNQIAQAVTPNHLDIISFDACLMQMLEIQDEVSGIANYMVCSEDNTPGPGYPYNTSFGQFFTTPTAPTTTLAKSIVDGFINFYDTDTDYNMTPLSHSVVDLSKVGAVTTALGAFSTNLIAGGTPVGADTQFVRQGLINYAAGDGYNYYDIGGIASGFASKSISAALTQSATALAAAEQAAVVYSRTDGHSPNSTGISLEFGSSELFNQYSSDYAQLQLAQDTKWPQFLTSKTLNP